MCSWNWRVVTCLMSFSSVNCRHRQCRHQQCRQCRQWWRWTKAQRELGNCCKLIGCLRTDCCVRLLLFPVLSASVWLADISSSQNPAEECLRFPWFSVLFHCFTMCISCPPTLCDIFHDSLARYSLFMPKLPLNTKQLTNLHFFLWSQRVRLVPAITDPPERISGAHWNKIFCGCCVKLLKSIDPLLCAGDG